MENADQEIGGKYTFMEESANVIEIADDDGPAAEEIAQTMDFNESAISKLLDAVEKLNRIQELQKRVALELNLTQEEENENVLEGTVTFPLKSLKEFQNLERMSTNESYRKNLTKSLRLLLIKGAIQDPIKNLLDDTIVMHFSWDEPNKPCVISLRHTICFGHVIYNALGMGFTDYANFVHTCLTLAQARSQNSDVCTLNTIRAESQFQHFAYVVSDISQRISDIEIFQKRIEAYTCLKKHEVDPKIYFPIATAESLQKLEEILQYRIVQEVVVSYCKDLYAKNKSLKSIVLDDFLANYSLNGQCKKSDLFRFTFFNHTLYVALEMSRLDYEVEVAHQIDCAAERTFGKGSQEAPDEATDRVNKILTHRKVVMIRKEDLAEQGIPRKLREIFRKSTCDGKSRATIFTDSGNFVSFAKVEKTEKLDSSTEDLNEKVAKYFPLKSLKAHRAIQIKLLDDHFRFSMQQVLDEFYHNRKFSIKDVISEDFLVNVDEADLFSGSLMKDFLPLILSLPPRSFLRMAKLEFRALKSALELRRANYSELLQLRIEVGNTVELPKSPNGSFRHIFPLTTIQEFDDLERNLEYGDFFRQISNACKIILMKEKKFKLTQFIGDEVITKYSAKGSSSTLSLMETKLFGEILREFAKLEEPEFSAILHKHHSNAMAKLKSTQVFPSDGDSQADVKPEAKKRKRQFVEVVFPLANKNQLLLVDENLRDEGFRSEIEKVLGNLLRRKGESVQEIPLEDILEEDLLTISTWDDNETTSLKVYSLFRDVIFKLTSVAWPSYDEMMQKAFKKLTKSEKSPAEENIEAQKPLNDFVIIPPPQKKSKCDTNAETLPSSNAGVPETSPKEFPPFQESQNSLPISESYKSAKQDPDVAKDVVCDSEDDGSNVNGFEQILPIKSKEEFLHMENMLTDNNFATYFSLLCSSCDDKTALLRDIINEDALRYFTWQGTADTLRFQGTMLCSILSARAYGSNMSILKAIIDSVQEKAASQDVASLFPITSKENLKTVESYLPHIKAKMVQHFTEIRQKIGNGVFSQMFSPDMINSLNQSELESFAKTPFYREVIQVVFKDIKRFHILEAIRDEFETPEGFFKRILPVNEINLALFELKLQRKPFVDCLIAICTNWMKAHSDGYFHKLIDSDLIQQYSFNGDDGLRAIEKSILFNTVLREIYKKSDMELHTKVQMELYLAQALADYKSDKLQS